MADADLTRYLKGFHNFQRFASFLKTVPWLHASSRTIFSNYGFNGELDISSRHWHDYLLVVDLDVHNNFCEVDSCDPKERSSKRTSYSTVLHPFARELTTIHLGHSRLLQQDSVSLLLGL